MLVADNHGDWVDPKTEEVIFAFLKDFRPEIRIHLGDVWEFACLRKGADEEERSVELEADWLAGKEFLRNYFWRGKQNVLLLGNHDDRLWELAKNTHAAGESKAAAHGMLEDFEALRKKANIQTVLPYDSREGVYELGHLKCIHGYHAGENAGRQHARIYGNCVYGHTHTIESATAHSYDEPKESRGVGAACRLDRPFNKKQTNKLRHSNGFAYGFLFDDGRYQLFQSRKIGDEFYAATNIKAY